MERLFQIYSYLTYLNIVSAFYIFDFYNYIIAFVIVFDLLHIIINLI